MGQSALTFGESEPTAEVEALTEAHLLGTVTANNITVTADSRDDTFAGSESLSIGAVTISNSTVIAITTPMVNAVVGGSVRATNDLVVTSTSFSDADSSATSVSGAILDIADLVSTVEAEPTVTAEVRPDAELVAGGTVTITASHGVPPPNYSDGTFDATAVGVTVDDASNTWQKC